LTVEELIPRLRHVLVENLALHGLDPESITADEPLFSERLGLDSVDALELVVALEREFGVPVPSEEIGGEAFSTLRTLAGWLAPRLPSASGTRPA